MDNLFKKSFVPWKLVARNELAQWEADDHAKKQYIKNLVISQVSSSTQIALSNFEIRPIPDDGPNGSV